MEAGHRSQHPLAGGDVRRVGVDGYLLAALPPSLHAATRGHTDRQRRPHRTDNAVDLSPPTVTTDECATAHPTGRQREEQSTMPQWQVRDVMTTEVITAPDDASIAEIIAVLTDRQITAVPIVDSFDVILGVVSWTDLRKKIDIDAPEGKPDTGWWRRLPPRQARWPQGTAVEVMSSPALTIAADTSLPAAARMMYRRQVGRLLVVDRDNRLRGIVTRSDLLKVHARLDAVIRDEVLHRILTIPAGAVQATVDDGVVTLTGNTARKTTAVAAVGLAEAVPGVTAVVDRLAFDLDDTVAAIPARQPAEPDPLHGWWIGRPSAGAADRVPADPMVNHHEPTPAMSATPQ
jgi:CBS domain-containing protein